MTKPLFSGSHRFVFGAVVLAVMTLYAASIGAADGPAASSDGAAKNKPVTLEAIAGTGLKRITLTAKAAERLGIQTGKITEEVVVRRQLVSGMVVYPQKGAAKAESGATVGGFGGFVAAGAAAPALKPVSTHAAAIGTGPSVVIVNLSPGEYERLDKGKPARITPLYTREKTAVEMMAPLSDQPPIEDAKRTMLTLHYLLPNSDHGLPSSTRMRVELQQTGTDDKQKVVPYNAVHYDAKGQSWVYVNTQGLTYERQKITITRGVGKAAVLSEGPAVDTAVVTVGASMLYGTEVFGK